MDAALAKQVEAQEARSEARVVAAEVAGGVLGAAAKGTLGAGGVCVCL